MKPSDIVAVLFLIFGTLFMLLDLAHDLYPKIRDHESRIQSLETQLKAKETE